MTRQKMFFPAATGPCRASAPLTGLRRRSRHDNNVHAYQHADVNDRRDDRLEELGMCAPRNARLPDLSPLLEIIAPEEQPAPAIPPRC
jgi:hypothetical protein